MRAYNQLKVHAKKDTFGMVQVEGPRVPRQSTSIVGPSEVVEAGGVRENSAGEEVVHRSI